MISIVRSGQPGLHRETVVSKNLEMSKQIGSTSEAQLVNVFAVQIWLSEFNL